jgi:hypothetical protein
VVNTERPWARHYFDEWQSRAGDPRLPYWLRVAALAFGSHEDNGHARFKRGEIALVLGTPARPYTNVRRAIGDAVTYGWLADGSFWGCLIVPLHAVRKGPWATPKPCPIHTNRSLSERKGPISSTPDERFEPVTAHSVSGSERAPLFLICPPTPTDNLGEPGVSA